MQSGSSWPIIGGRRIVDRRRGLLVRHVVGRRSQTKQREQDEGVESGRQQQGDADGLERAASSVFLQAVREESAGHDDGESGDAQRQADRRDDKTASKEGGSRIGQGRSRLKTRYEDAEDDDCPAWAIVRGTVRAVNQRRRSQVSLTRSPEPAQYR